MESNILLIRIKRHHYLRHENVGLTFFINGESRLNGRKDEHGLKVLKDISSLMEIDGGL